MESRNSWSLQARLLPGAWWHVGGFGDICFLLLFFLLGGFFGRDICTFLIANTEKEKKKLKYDFLCVPVCTELHVVGGYAHYFGMTLQF